MAKYKRSNDNGHHDHVQLTAAAGGDADGVLKAAGFVPDGEASEDSGDEDGIPGPPSHAAACEGGINGAPPNEQEWSIKLWSSDEDGGGVGFLCKHDAAKAVFYAQLASESDWYEAIVTPKSLVENPMKGAIASLLDVAESFNARKVTLGLNSDNVGRAEWIRSLLYLGFQVVPSRRCPFFGAALLLEFDIGCQSSFSPPLSPALSFTGTSECSTAAEDWTLDSEESDSDCSL